VFFFALFPSHASSSNIPVIGILSQPLINSSYTYIAASYVKWLEVGGATSIAIPFDASTDLVKDVLSQVDGVLFPGGGAPVPQSAKDVWRLLHEAYYPRHDMVPLWGTCLGMEFIVQLAANNFDDTVLEDGYNATNVSLPLLQVKREGLYKPQYIYESVLHHNVTMNNHHLGISPERFRATKSLTSQWQITSTNVDLDGKPFVSTMEPTERHKNPIYGVQFHPEKNAFEYGFYPNTTTPYEAIDHSPEGIALSIHLAGYFVNLAKENMMKARPMHRNENRLHKGTSKYTKSGTYPIVYEYPRTAGFKFEERFIIPPASSWPQETGVDQSSSPLLLRRRSQ
jgi:gamma-glutamyl hydrolase